MTENLEGLKARAFATMDKIELGKKIIAQGIIELGSILNEIKPQIGHGDWKRWLAENFTGKYQLSYRTAARYMEIARRFEKVSLATLLSKAQLTELLRLTEGDEENFLEAMAAKGTPVEGMPKLALRAEIATWQDKYEAAVEENQRLKAENRALKNFSGKALKVAVVTTEILLDSDRAAKLQAMKRRDPAKYRRFKSSVAQLHKFCKTLDRKPFDFGKNQQVLPGFDYYEKILRETKATEGGEC